MLNLSIDVEATKARRFKNKRSHVTNDGRDVLYGADYKRRVREVLERDDYRCKWPLATATKNILVACGASANEHPHHIIKRSIQRDDRALNLISICNAHHKIAHPEKQVRWTKQEASDERQRIA